MSVIETFYDTTVTITRGSTSTPTSGDSITTIGTVIGVFRPVSDKADLYIENNTGNEFDFFCDEPTDIEVGDDLISTETYNVLGVSVYEDLEDDTESYLKARVSKS